METKITGIDTYQLTDQAARLLRSLLLDYQQKLLFTDAGEPWQAEELELTDILIETFASVDTQ